AAVSAESAGQQSYGAPRRARRHRRLSQGPAGSGARRRRVRERGARGGPAMAVHAHTSRRCPHGSAHARDGEFLHGPMTYDPEYLDSIRRYERKILLGEADAQVVALKPVTP